MGVKTVKITLPLSGPQSKMIGREICVVGFTVEETYALSIFL